MSLRQGFGIVSPRFLFFKYLVINNLHPIFVPRMQSYFIEVLTAFRNISYDKPETRNLPVGNDAFACFRLKVSHFAMQKIRKIGQKSDGFFVKNVCAKLFTSKKPQLIYYIIHKSLFFI